MRKAIMSFYSRFKDWQIHQAAEAYERDRAAFLNSAPPRNDPALLAPTRVRVLKPFRLKGEPVAVGQIVTLERHDALSLQALGRCELME
jgi:hypothetical protein